MKEKPTQTLKTSKEPNLRAGHRERLRNRLRNAPPNAVADHELLELILFRAVPRCDVKETAHRLINQFGDLAAVLAAPPAQLRKIKGIGEESITEFKIVEAAALRIGQSKIMHNKALQSWDALIRYCRTKLAEKKVEEFHVLFLNKQNQIIADEVLGRGTVDHTPVYPREVIKRALELDTTALIIVHNHPSGDPSPSRADIDMTKKLDNLCREFGMTLFDHLVIGRKDEYSFKNNGLLN